MALMKITPEMAQKALAETDWSKVDAMTDAQIEAAAASDPDAAPIRSPEEITAARVVAIRKSTGLTQRAFAEAYGIPLGTLRDWEQAKSAPDATARSYMRAIEREPKAIALALAH